MKNSIQAVKSALFSSESINLLKEYLEIGVDHVLNDGMLKEIPLISTLFSIYKFGNSVRQKHEIQKTIAFLESLKEITEEEKQTFLERLNREDKNGKIYEQIMLQLERLDETIKAEMIGNLFRVYIMGKIERHTMLRCFAVIERAYIADLLELYIGFNHLVGKQAIDQEKFKIHIDKSIRLNDLNNNLKTLGILRKDLVLLTDRYKKENGLGDGQYYADSSLNEIGKALSVFIF